MTSTTSFPIKNCLLACLLVWLLFLNSNEFQFVKLAVILFSENDLIAFWNSAVSVFTSNITDFKNDNILSSAELCRDVFLMQEKKSFKNLLNGNGPKIEPCGTREIRLYLWCHYYCCWHKHIVYSFSNRCNYISEHCHYVHVQRVLLLVLLSINTPLIV